VLPGALVAERFQIEAVAGMGGMGTVYRAVDRETGLKVALKLMRGGHRDRFLREARALMELRSPAIVSYVAHGEIGADELFLAMEWVDGENLAQRLRQRPLTLRESLLLARNVAAGLAVAHQRGVVHRDLKPSNLILPDGDLSRVKLLDFGVAELVGQDLTRTGGIVGTPAYMAPEQARGERPVGPRADVFSLGAMLFECVTGRLPFEGDNAIALLAKLVLSDAPRALSLRPDLPPSIDSLLARLLSRAPADRPADAGEVLSELSRLGPLDAFDEHGSPGPTGAARLLTGSEQRVVCILMLDLSRIGDERQDLAATLPPTEPRPLDPILASLGRAVETYRGRLERLLDGTVLCTLAGAGAATDQAAQAARCALALRALVPGAPIALATGRAVVSGAGAVGEAIDRAATLLQPTPGSIQIDALTARLLGERFALTGGPTSFGLQGERAGEPMRTLLGRRTPCVGRERELSLLRGVADGCLEESSARAVLLLAPAGVGKSRLRHELTDQLRSDGKLEQILIARCDPLRQGSPLAVVAQLLQAAASVEEAAPLPLRRDMLRAHLERLLGDAVDVDHATAFLGELVGAPPDEASPALRAARLDPQLMGGHLRRAAEEWLRAFAGAAPTALLLEDLHWADGASLQVIDAALGALADRPLFVLALARPEVKDAFPSLWADRAVHELHLAPLGKKPSALLIREMMGADVSDELVARLVDHAGGNAFFLEELIRAAVEQHTQPGLATPPETVLAMTQLRLERFSPDVRRVLRAASVFGPTSWRGGIAALLGGEAGVSALGDTLRLLVEREVLTVVSRSRFSGEQELRFRHALLRDAAYAMLTVEDCAVGHGLAGEWLEAAGERDPAVLARHFEKGADPSRALRFYRRAVDQALEGLDLATTLSHIERGRACGAAGEALAHLMAVGGEARFGAGDYAGAEQSLREALAVATVGSDAWYRAAATLLALAQHGQVQMLPQIVAAVRDRPVPDEPSLHHLLVWFVIASSFLIVGLGEEAAAFQRRMEEALPRVKSPMAKAWALYGRCLAAEIRDRDPDRAYESICEARELALAIGDRRTLTWLTLQTAKTAFVVGAYDEAERLARQVLATVDDVGLARSMAQLYLSRALGCTGRLDEAVALQREANRAFAQQHNSLFLGFGRQHLAMLLLRKGELAAAEKEAVAAADEVFAPPHRGLVLATLAHVRLAQGNVDAALGDAEAAWEAMRIGGSVQEGESLIYWVRVRALAAAGRTDLAAQALEESRARLDERLAKFTDPKRRERFLAVEENQALTSVVYAGES